MTDINNDGLIETRVGRLEGAVESLTLNVQEISKTVKELTGSIGSFKEAVLSKLGQATQPKWPLIISFAMLIATILGLGGTIVTLMASGQHSAIEYNKQCINNIDEQLHKQYYEHGRLSAFQESIQKELDRIIAP